MACVIDADTLIDADALFAHGGPVPDKRRRRRYRRVHPSGQRGDQESAEVLRNLNAGYGVVGDLRLQHPSSSTSGRLGWNRLGGNLIISGAFGLFRRDAVMAAGGYTEGTVGEDMELFVRLRRRGLDNGSPHRIVFVLTRWHGPRCRRR